MKVQHFLIYFVRYYEAVIMKRTITILLLSIVSYVTFAQADTIENVKCDYSFLFEEGIYPDFNSFKNNSPIPFESMNSPAFDDSFFENIASSETISYNDENGINITVEKIEIWGYCKKGKPYILWAEKFVLVPFVGQLSHFITTIKVTYTNYRDPYYDPYYYNPASREYQSDELRQFLIDMETGEILDYSLPNVEYLLKRDPRVYDEFMKLRKRKRGKEMFYYVKLYNELNPLYVPKTKEL